jgi:tetratricopeptide (TPR) repeat protein
MIRRAGRRSPSRAPRRDLRSWIAPALLALALAAPALRAADAPPAPPVLPFVEDDYGRALEAARSKGLPLFVEAWAPWCHTCRSMRAFVFTDKALAPRAGEFVWLSIDTEKKSNAPFLTKYPVEAWPTYLVVDPKSETVALRWVGGATVPQLQGMLDEGRLAVRGGEKGVDAAVARADRLYGEKRNAEAAAAYRDAISRAPAGWKPYPRAVESLLFTLRRLGDFSSCAKQARDSFARLAGTPSAASVVQSGLDCALRVPESDAGRSGLVAALTADARTVLSRPRPDVAADDVSSLYETLADEREAARDPQGERKVFEDWAAFLEAQAAAAKTPIERSVFDAHRLTAYLALGQPDKAIPMLKQSEKDFPDDYNPAARLVVAYEAKKDYEMALAASDKALSKAYGPRLILLLTVRSRVYQEKGDAVSARVTMEEAIREAEALPPGQRSETQIQSLRRRLDQLPASPAS